MKKGNVTILASILAIVLVATGVGAGTMAWFSTVPATAGPYTMSAAEMKMEVTTGTYTFEKLVPGKDFGPVTIKIVNTGDMDINYLCGDLIITDANGNPYASDTASGVLLANYIEITSWKEWIPASGIHPAIVGQENIGTPQFYELAVGDCKTPLTLMELAKSYWGGEPAWASDRKLDQFGGWVGTTTDWTTGNGYDAVPSGQPALAFGGTYYMEFMFKLSGENTPNTMQGQSCSFKITFLGMQDQTLRP